MSRTNKVFIGSSSEAKIRAQLLHEILNEDKQESVIWYDFFDRNATGEYNFEVLKKAVDTHRVGMFFITLDDDIKVRAKKLHTTRVNVWLEVGMFVATYDRRNVFLWADANDLPLLAIPSDANGVTLATYKLPEKIKDQIKSGTITAAARQQFKSILKAEYDLRVRHKLNELASRPTQFVQYISDRKSCYAWGKTLIQNAEEFIYTIASYEEELDRGDGLYPDILKRIKTDRKKGRKPPKVKRWMNFGDKETVAQARKILSECPEDIVVRDTYCKFIEAVVTEHSTLLVLPNRDGTIIGSGLLIESEDIARQFAGWFLTLPAPIDLDITHGRLDAYLGAKIRNNGSREAPCVACSTPAKDVARFCAKAGRELDKLRNIC